MLGRWGRGRAFKDSSPAFARRASNRLLALCCKALEAIYLIANGCGGRCESKHSDSAQLHPFHAPVVQPFPEDQQRGRPFRALGQGGIRDARAVNLVGQAIEQVLQGLP